MQAKLKTALLLVLIPLLSIVVVGQQKEAAERLVDEGVAYHDKGDYDGALARYDSALHIDNDNLLAMTEKALTLLSMERYDEAITLCKLAIGKQSNESYLPTVYITYGNALDALKKTDESLEIYEQGLKRFPNAYQLYYNKGITLASVRKNDAAILCFQKAIMLNPKHASSHNAIAHLLDGKSRRIPPLLAYCRFLVVELKSKRANANLERVQKLMNGNVKEKGDKSVTVNIDPDLLADTTKEGKPKENCFTTTELILAMDAALHFDEKNKKKTEVEEFIRIFTSVCSSLQESRSNNYGFYWDYYVPYFTEMKDKKFIEAFAYIAFASSEDPSVAKWIKENQSAIDQFYDWSSAFSWKSN